MEGSRKCEKSQKLQATPAGIQALLFFDKNQLMELADGNN